MRTSVRQRAQREQLVTDFKQGPGNGVYSFASTTPKALPELVRPSMVTDTVNIVGHLFMPPGNGKVPAVLLMHGSGGIYDAMLDYWPKLLNAQGIAVFSLDRFGPRGVKSTAEDQSQVPFAADVADAFAALRLLASHPGIDAKRIAIMGFSRGGIASWRTAVERIAAAQQPDGLRFAAHIQAYSGGCVGVFRLIAKPGVFSKAPELWLHGDADDYTPIGPCRDYSQSIADAGTPVVFVDFPGAYHTSSTRTNSATSPCAALIAPSKAARWKSTSIPSSPTTRTPFSACREMPTSKPSRAAAERLAQRCRETRRYVTRRVRRRWHSCTKYLRSDAAIDQVGADLQRPFLWRSAVAEQCLAPFFRA